MNLNILGYAVYLLITSVIIVRVGRSCYQNGNVFVSALLPDHEALCLKINQLLLIGYYLLNLGYCAMTLIAWEKIGSFDQLVEVIAFRSAVIIGTIALMHYCNIFIITQYIQKLI